MSRTQSSEDQECLSPSSVAKNKSTANLVRHAGSWMHSGGQNALSTRPRQLNARDLANGSSEETREHNYATTFSSSEGATAGDQSGQPKPHKITSATKYHRSTRRAQAQGPFEDSEATMSSRHSDGSSMQAQRGDTPSAMASNKS